MKAFIDTRWKFGGTHFLFTEHGMRVGDEYQAVVPDVFTGKLLIVSIVCLLAESLFKFSQKWYFFVKYFRFSQKLVILC